MEIVDRVVCLYEGDSGVVVCGDRVDIPLHELEIMVSREARVYMHVSMDEEQVCAFKVIQVKEYTKVASFVGV